MSRHRLDGTRLLAATLALFVAAGPCFAGRPTRLPDGPGRPGPRTELPVGAREFTSLRLAITDLIETFGARYPDGPKFVARLDALAKRGRGTGDEFRRLQQEALLANPLLDFGRLLVVKRKIGKDQYRDLGIPANGASNCQFTRRRYDNEIAILSPIRPDGKLTTSGCSIRRLRSSRSGWTSQVNRATQPQQEGEAP